jgi:hypothetical protein
MVSIGTQLPVGATVRVTLLESGCRTISVVPTGQAGLRVSAVGADYIVLDDEEAGVKTRIPSHFIRSIEGQAANGQEAA